MKRIAIPICDNCVSNVFDFADLLLILEIEGGEVVSRVEKPIEGFSLLERIGCLKELGSEVLICGAISRALANMVSASGIELLAYVTGDVDEVLGAYINGELSQSQYLKLGCWSGARNGFGGCGMGRGRGRGARRWRGGREQF